MTPAHRVKTARSLYRAGLTLRQVGARLSVSDATVLSWLTGKVQYASRIPDPLGPVAMRPRSVPRSGLTWDTARQARKLDKEGETYAEIGRSFGVHRAAIRRVCLGMTWREQA